MRAGDVAIQMTTVVESMPARALSDRLRESLLFLALVLLAAGVLANRSRGSSIGTTGSGGSARSRWRPTRR